MSTSRAPIGGYVLCAYSNHAVQYLERQATAAVRAFVNSLAARRATEAFASELGTNSWSARRLAGSIQSIKSVLQRFSGCILPLDSGRLWRKTRQKEVSAAEGLANAELNAGTVDRRGKYGKRAKMLARSRPTWLTMPCGGLQRAERRLHGHAITGADIC